MKTARNLLYVLFAVSLAFTGCKEDDDYERIGIPEGMEAFFSPTNKSSIALEEDASSFTVELSRGKSAEAADIAIESEAATGISVPAVISFAAGADKATLTVTVDQSVLTPGETYPVKISLEQTNATPYGASTITVRVTTWAPAAPETWEPIETEAMLKEGILNIAFTNAPESLFDVYVEKLVGKERYRIANPFTTYTSAAGKTYTHPVYEPGEEVSPEVNWFVIDLTGEICQQENGVTLRPGDVWLPLQPLNVDWGYGPMQTGSVAYNLAAGGQGLTPADYAIGSYDENNGIIYFGMLGLQLPSEGWFVTTSTNKEAWATLYLDKSKMGINFERDFTFEEEAIGSFVSQATGTKWDQSLYKGTMNDPAGAAEFEAQYGTVYMFPDLYTEGFPIYFCVRMDNGKPKVVLPNEYKSQLTGQVLLNEKVMLEIERTSIIEGDVYNFDCKFVTEKGIEFQTKNEIFTILRLEPGESIDDFVGDFTMSATENLVDSDQNPLPPVTNAAVSITKVDETNGKIKGLSYGRLGPGYDDSIDIEFAEGYCTIAAGQNLPTWQGYNVQTLFFTEGLEGIYGAGPLRMRIAKVGDTMLQIVNDPANQNIKDQDTGEPITVVGFYIGAFDAAGKLAGGLAALSDIRLTYVGGNAPAYVGTELLSVIPSRVPLRQAVRSEDGIDRAFDGKSFRKVDASDIRKANGKRVKFF